MFKSQEKLIAEIHNEFDTAQERLLSEAKSVLDASSKDRTVEISERLKAVGFVRTPTARKGDSVKKRLVTSEEQAELIQYYQQTYPFLKFLTEDELNRICDKYRLIHAPVSNYKEDVPEKNLKDIECAQPLRLQDSEVANYKFVINRIYYNRKQSSLDDLLIKLGLVNGRITKFSVRQAMILAHGANYGMLEYYTEQFQTSNTWLFSAANKLGLVKDRNYDYDTCESIDRGGLFIAAPTSHFDLSGLEKKSKHGFFSVLKTEVKDPIVFRYVRGGVQVITKWGLEANDPSLVVPVLN
jgi:hypothetical protein